jgi:hypothetical protein
MTCSFAWVEDHQDRASPAIVHATIFGVSIAPKMREISRMPFQR